MLASVVVNNHNYGRFLRAAIDSALAQTHPQVEVIAVDDGSTDGSRDVIASYGDQITPVYKENGGQASAINAGFARSHGEIVLFLDSDDILESDIVAHVVAAFEADPAVVWVMFPLEIIDVDGRRTGVFRPPPHMTTRDGDLRDHVLSFPFDIVRTATSANAFSASVLRKILPIPEATYFSGADWYLSPMVGLFGRCVFLDVLGGKYRVHGTNDNWFEHPSMKLDLRGLRRELRYMEVSAATIQQFAAAAGPVPREEILSVSFIGARMVSRKLAPAGHPFVDDTPLRLFRWGVLATRRRFDVRWPMKLMFIGWFALMAVAPISLAVYLARMWYFPRRRGPLNAALSLFYVPARSRPATG
jgi:glycosyltransferase involved in cell wall biosynthesis